ncbi:unnamed protein product [Allacma fusca]|uniref:Uncharacterized protein n=1 Tax=Allacma fusca TaxID=39272 RepID=A0A8J2JH82_9HEXA|nr:unnamed protein product [Allacma fusca]
MSDVLYGQIEIPDSDPINFVSISPQLQANQPKLCALSFGISHRQFLILGTILTTVLVTALIASQCYNSTTEAGTLGNSKEAGTETERPFGFRQTESKGSILAAPSASNQLTVDFATDLKDLTFEQDTIVIKGLDEEYLETYSFIISEHTNVKNLTIIGPISSKWLKFLVRKFPLLTSLTIHMDEACPETDKSYGYSFKSVTNLVLNNLSICGQLVFLA